MTRRVVILVLTCFALALTTAGCSDSDSPDENRGDLISANYLQSYTQEEILEAPVDSLRLGGRLYHGDDQAFTGFIDEIKKWLRDTFLPYTKYWPVDYSIEYVTEDAGGNKLSVSGLVVIPTVLGENDAPLSFPILSVQHPTEVERANSPSRHNITDVQGWLYRLIAMTGYIVVVADYPGLGVSNDPHPYCHTSLANSVIDLIKVCEGRPWTFHGENTYWNGELYLIGYSEGGYATMVTAMQLQETRQYPVIAAAALDGPYSLAGTMRDVMLTADWDDTAPYFLPYVVAGYDSVYRDIYPEFDYYACVRASVEGYTPPEGSSFAHELYKRLDGSYTGTQISEFMKLAAGEAEGVKAILTEEFVTHLQDLNSVVVRTLAENNSYFGWTPRMPLKMIHNIKDDFVPVGNMTEAVAGFPNVPNLIHEEFSEYFDIPDVPVHVGAFPIAFWKGFSWIDSYAYPERHTND